MSKGTTSGESKNTLYCSFCGKSQHEVRKLIAGPTVFICDECVELCMDIIREEHKTSIAKTKDGVPSPRDICKVLDDYVIGQDHAKRVLSDDVHAEFDALVADEHSRARDELAHLVLALAAERTIESVLGLSAGRAFAHAHPLGTMVRLTII